MPDQNTKIDEIAVAVAEISKTLKHHDGRFDEHDKQFAETLEMIRGIANIMATKDDIADLKLDIGKVSNQLDKHSRDELDKRILLENRVTVLENKVSA